MEILIFRSPREIWVWRHGVGLRPIHEKEFIELVSPENGEDVRGSRIYMEVEGWAGDALDFKVSYSRSDSKRIADHMAYVRWDPASNKLQLRRDVVEGVRDIQ